MCLFILSVHLVCSSCLFILSAACGSCRVETWTSQRLGRKPCFGVMGSGRLETSCRLWSPAVVSLIARFASLPLPSIVIFSCGRFLDITTVVGRGCKSHTYPSSFLIWTWIRHCIGGSGATYLVAKWGGSGVHLICQLWWPYWFHWTAICIKILETVFATLKCLHLDVEYMQF